MSNISPTDSLMLLDYNSLLPFIADFMSPNAPAPLREALRRTPLTDYAEQVLVNLPPAQRVPTYLDTNADRLKRTVAAFGAEIRYRVGFSRVAASLPCLEAMANRWALSLLLSLLLDIIGAVLLFLSG